MRTLDELGISPAPWRVGAGDSSQLIYDLNDAYFAFLYSARDITANARLIAAAPMLYEALRQLVNYLSLNNWTDRELDPFIAAADAALAAASGESEARNE